MFKRTTLLFLALAALVAGSAVAAGPVKGPFAGTVHAVGAITYRDGSQQTWNWDRGKITALDTSSITLMRRDRQSVTFALTSTTLVRNDGATYTLADLKVGQAATVISQSGNAVLIRNIRGDGAPSGADQSAIEGPGAKAVTGTIDALYVDGSTQHFDFNRGRIVKVGEGTLTIMRADHETVDFTYDETTLVKCRGELGSLDDLKVGMGATFFSQSGALKLVRCPVQPKRVHPPTGPRASAAGPAAARPAAA